MKRCIFFSLVLFSLISSNAWGKDWPVFKGNLYFTGNNDEIIVKNNHIKWLFVAPHRIFYPIVSEGKIYFTDIKKHLYCIDEETGTLLWRIDLKKISKQFSAYSRGRRKISGKIKYPLISKQYLIITDSIAVYCFHKLTGDVIWARTGLVQKNYRSRKATAVVESIYADPFIHNERIFYGTRSHFYARNLKDGKLLWDNQEIHTYSAFGAFYGDYLFTQSRDYANNQYYLYCLKISTGETVWKKPIEVPFKIFPPVVHDQKVIIPSGKKIYAFNLKDGSPVYVSNVKEYITSSPAFTDKAIRLTLSNNKVATLNVENGKIIDQTKFPDLSGPRFVTIQDQIYVSYTEKVTPTAQTGSKKTNRKPYLRTRVEAHSLDDKKEIWNFTAKYPGSPSEPVAENGILYVPAGKFLYALGEKGDNTPKDFKDLLRRSEERTKKEEPNKKSTQPAKKNNIKMRQVEVEVQTQDNSTTELEIIAEKDGKIIYNKTIRLKPGKNIVDVPANTPADFTASSKNHLPEKTTIKKTEIKTKIKLRKIEKQKAYVMNSIHFESEKSYLKKNSKSVLKKIVTLMEKNPALKLTVSGHTDSSGKRSFNLYLSRKRATSVTEFLIKNGISSSRLKAVGKGPDKPIANNKTKPGRQKNRRTEFRFH